MLKFLKNHNYVKSSTLKHRFSFKYKQNYSSYAKMDENLEHDSSFARYQESIEKLNELQPVQAIKTSDFSTLKDLRLTSTKLMCKKLNLTDEDINKLNVIHITGTKGKGSTSAFSESILRNLGYKTGLFTSPHLIEVKERIKINGRSLSYLKFHEYFSHCYNILINNWSREDKFDRPTYFQFLTCMSFFVFSQEKVDAAIVEVGIGGQFDFTNIVEQPIVCGISSLGLDHCSLLGSTIDKIAWQKAGILKSSCVGFISQQDSKEALNVLKERSLELNAPICIVNNVDKYVDLSSKNIDLGINGKVQYLNSQLALQITNYWIQTQTQKNFNKNQWIEQNIKEVSEQGIPILQPIVVLDDLRKEGITSCKWPGRNQIIESDNKNIKYYLDGAHTVESIEQFLNWFLDVKKNEPNFKNEKNVLLFNYTGERDPSKFLELLTALKFDAVAFSKLKAFPDELNKEKDTFRKMPSVVLDNDEKYENLLKMYINLADEKYKKCDVNNNEHFESKSQVFDNILESLDWLTDSRDEVLRKKLSETKAVCTSSDNDQNINVLITGSLYLVGLALKVLRFKID
ncbi:unnamed protein product [Brachionus calyciflorus]|uniref:tetrahydrofolate synthase n=1 Tax=Brachionus calyciflorus TaxID=104777 RepID=A0A813M2F6_9BILA|nr:unnamed protein product [Brachionus calyciflorus]